MDEGNRPTTGTLTTAETRTAFGRPVRRVAQEHGRIVIERSEPGAGTVFALSLPLAPVETRVAADPNGSLVREPHLSPR